MKIGIVGFGRMGKLIREICLERGHSIPLIVDPSAEPLPDGTTRANNTAEADLALADTVIDFSFPDGVIDNIHAYAEAGVAAVIGTTGWEAERPGIRSLIEQKKATLLYGSNFSVGANLFFAMTAQLARLIDGFP
ncbi:MAG: 4-hydroxy-tetrahydrodipicolinate reductase, partial [Spirochaeta sp.]